MSNKEERLQKIKTMLSRQPVIPIQDLAELFDVSEMTIRRDAKLLANDNIAKIENGMLISSNILPNSNISYELYKQSQIQLEAKKRIGKFAASLIREKEVVIFDTGTTTEQITAQLPPSIDIVAVCFNLNNLINLSRYNKITIELAGGHYYRNTQLFVSSQGIDYIRQIRANKVFLSMAGAHKELGITCANRYEVSLKKAIINSAIEKILVADSTKFGTVNLAYFCNFSDIDVIITDDNLSDDWREFIESKGIKLYCV